MSFICRLTNKICTEPTITKHGNIFEKKEIYKYIKENDICPISGLVLTKEDIFNISPENKENIKKLKIEKKLKENIFDKINCNDFMSQIEIIEQEKENFQNFLSDLLEIKQEDWNTKDLTK